MQRELRFRVWSNEKCFKYIDNVSIETDGCYVSTHRLKVLHCGTLCDSHREDVITEQYIGIPDEDGIPIYENDIVRAKSVFDNTPVSGRVRFIGSRWEVDNHPLTELFEFQIIGNIHTE